MLKMSHIVADKKYSVCTHKYISQYFLSTARSSLKSAQEI